MQKPLDFGSARYFHLGRSHGWGVLNYYVGCSVLGGLMYVFDAAIVDRSVLGGLFWSTRVVPTWRSFEVDQHG
jgi:hypothetical protein